MIKIQFDVVVHGGHVRVRPAVVSARLVVQLQLDDLRHPFYPLGVGVLGEPPSPVAVAVETAVAVLVHVGEQRPDLPPRRLPVGYVVLLPHPLYHPAHLLRRQVEIGVRGVLYPELRLGHESLGYVGHDPVHLAYRPARLPYLPRGGEHLVERFAEPPHHHDEHAERQQHEECRYDHQYPVLADSLRHVQCRLGLFHAPTS